MAKYSPTPFTDFFSSTTTTANNNETVGKKFYFSAPCEFVGIKFYNVIAGGDFRLGVWLNGAEQVSYRKEISNTAIGVVSVLFDTSLVVTWDTIGTTQHFESGTFYNLALWERNASQYMYSTKSTKYSFNDNMNLHLGDSAWIAHDRGGRTQSDAGWAEPVSQGLVVALDPLIIRTLDTYDPTPFPNLASYHGGIALISDDRTVGHEFHILPPASDTEFVYIDGVRFYTYDEDPWTAKCSLWDPGSNQLATNTVACTGRGVYDCMFGAPVQIVRADVENQSADGFMAGVYNQTNNNVTEVNISPAPYPLIPYCWTAYRHTRFLPSEGLPNGWRPGDLSPTFAQASRWYPVAPLTRLGS